MMGTTIRVNVAGVGVIGLELINDAEYSVFDEQGICLGTLAPQELPEWTEDEYALSAILEELFDNGELILPYSDKDYYDDEQ